MNILTMPAFASGGAIGAALRLCVKSAVNKHFIRVLPLGTLAVNLFGSILFAGIGYLLIMQLSK